MAKFENLKSGCVGLVQQLENGRIVQIGLTQEQSDLLQVFLATISKDSPLVQMGEEYDMVLKSSKDI